MVGVMNQNCQIGKHCEKTSTDGTTSAWTCVWALFSYCNKCSLGSSSTKLCRKYDFILECWDVWRLKGSGWISWQQSGGWIRWSGWISSQIPLQIHLMLLTGGFPVNVICICRLNERKFSFTTQAGNFKDKEQMREFRWIIMSFLEYFL